MPRDLRSIARRNPWLVFLVHQAVVGGSAVGFLWTVRRLSGRSIHLGQDPIGIVDGAALIVLSAAVIAFTIIVYRWACGPDAPPLGIAIDLRRGVQFVGGLFAGFALFIWPFAAAILLGTAHVVERVDQTFGLSAAVWSVAVGLILLIVQAITEETANRAFPIQLWRKRSIVFRILIPSLLFAAIHLATEPSSFERVAVLVVAGLLQSIAYLFTGNIGLSAGLHAGANYALFSISGLWHAGAIWSVEGVPMIPNSVNLAIITLLFCLAYLKFGSSLDLSTDDTRESV